MSHRATPQASPLTTLLLAPGGTPHHSPVISSPTGGEPPHSAWASTPLHPGNDPIHPSTPYLFTPPISSMTPGLTSSTIRGGGDLPPQTPRSHQTRTSYPMDYMGTPQFSTTPYPMQPPTLHLATPLQVPASAPSQGGASPPSISHTFMPFISSMDPVMRPSAAPSGGYPPPQEPGPRHDRNTYPIDYSGYPWGSPRPSYPQSQQPQHQPQHQPQFQQPQPTGPFPGAKWGGFTPGHPTMGDPWPQMQQLHPPLAQFQPQFQQPQSAGFFPGMPWGGFIFGYIMMGNPWAQMQQLQPPPLAQVPMMQQPLPGPPPMQAPWGPLGHTSNQGGDQVDPFMRGGEHSGMPQQGTTWSVYSQPQRPRPQFQHQQPLPQYQQPQFQQIQPTGPFLGGNPAGFTPSYMMTESPWAQMRQPQRPLPQTPMLQQPPPNPPPLQAPGSPLRRVPVHEQGQADSFMSGEHSGMPSRGAPEPEHPQPQQPRSQFQQPQTADLFTDKNRGVSTSSHSTMLSPRAEMAQQPTPDTSQLQTPEGPLQDTTAHEGDRVDPSISSEYSGVPPQSTPEPVHPQPQRPRPQIQQPQPAGPFPDGERFVSTPTHSSTLFPWAETAQQPTPDTSRIQAPGDPLQSTSAHEGDRVNPFMSGEHYGPALQPLLVHVIGVQLKINPLLQPVPDDAPDRPHLKWNMLFPSGDCQRSTDPSHISWAEGRDEPATFPRVTSLRIVSEGFPWMIKVEARKLGTGVTCGNLIDSLSRFLNVSCTRADYEAMPPRKKRLIGKAYHYNRSHAHGVPGSTLETGLKRLDFLCDTDTLFGGIVNDEEYLMRITEVVMPCTVALKCLRRVTTTRGPIQDQEVSVGNFKMS